MALAAAHEWRHPGSADVGRTGPQPGRVADALRAGGCPVSAAAHVPRVVGVALAVET